MLTQTALQKLNEHKEYLLESNPNTDTIDDPDYVPTGELDEVIPQIPKYTLVQWAHELTRRYWRQRLKVGYEKIERKKIINKDFGLE